MNSRTTAATLLIGGLLAAPGLARKVKTAAGEHIDFTAYKTYQWLPTKSLTSTGTVENDPRVTPAIKDAVNRELTARGLREVAEGGDLQVATFAMTVPVPQLEAVLFPGNVAMDFATPIATMGRWNKEGTLAINLIDARTGKSAWVGLVTDSIDTKPGSGLGKIPGATQAMFNKYPIKKK